MPICVVYGRDSAALRSYEQGDTRVPMVDTAIADRDSFLVDICTPSRHILPDRRLGMVASVTASGIVPLSKYKGRSQSP